MAVSDNKPTLAENDCTVTDAHGVDRKIFAGRPVPNSLLEAYQAAQQPQEEPAAPEPQTSEETPTSSVLAKPDVEIDNEVTKAVQGPEVIKAQLSPVTDKAQETPKKSRRRSNR